MFYKNINSSVSLSFHIKALSSHFSIFNIFICHEDGKIFNITYTYKFATFVYHIHCIYIFNRYIQPSLVYMSRDSSLLYLSLIEPHDFMSVQ